MEDHIAAAREVAEQVGVFDRADDEMEPRVVCELRNVLPPARGKVVEYEDVVAACDAGISEVGTNETSTASNQYFHDRISE